MIRIKRRSMNNVVPENHGADHAVRVPLGPRT